MTEQNPKNNLPEEEPILASLVEEAPEPIDSHPLILENIVFSPPVTHPKTGRIEYKSPGSPGVRKIAMLSESSPIPEPGRPYKVKVIKDTMPDKPHKGMLIVELYYETPDEKALDIISKISETQKNAKTKEDWNEIARLLREIEALYETDLAEVVEETVEIVESPLFEQYEKQVAILQRLGVLKTLKSGEIGVEGVDSKEYPLPTFEQIAKKIEIQKEIIEKKQDQGFTRLLLVPFGAKLEELTEAYKKSILEHHKQGKLFTAKKDINDRNEQLVPLELDENNPLYVWDGYKNADAEGKLVYWPQEFSENHGGMTKQEVLKGQEEAQKLVKQKLMTGWDVIFVEENPNIPRQNKAKTVGDRTQLDTGGWAIQQYMKGGEKVPSPEEYLKGLNKESQESGGMYQYEKGMTPEDQLMYAITYLEEHDQIIDDYNGNGSLSYQIGAYFPASGGVPSAYWFRVSSRASMGGYDLQLRYDRCGVRPSVRI